MWKRSKPANPTANKYMRSLPIFLMAREMQIDVKYQIVIIRLAKVYIKTASNGDVQFFIERTRGMQLIAFLEWPYSWVCKKKGTLKC